MHRSYVSSSNLVSAGYDHLRNVLEIEFRQGRIYQYFQVPVSIYEGLMAASSKGQYHHRNIKYRYRYERVS